MSSRAVRCGIVGFGFMGPQHAEAMQRLGFVDVAAVCSTTPELAREKASRLGISRVYANYEDLLDDRDIDVIDIVTPTRLHHPIAMAALSRGKHVIVDKPLALNLEQAREMRNAARAAGVVHAVTFNYRYHPWWNVAKWGRSICCTGIISRNGCYTTPTSRGASIQRRAARQPWLGTRPAIGSTW
jgi:predicted dehydrogenase